MIVVSGEIEIHAGDREAALAAIRPMVEATRQEPGCRTYAVYESVEAANRFRIFEEWDSAEALAGHFQSAHMAAFNAALGSVKVTGMDVKQYEIASVGPIGG